MEQNDDDFPHMGYGLYFTVDKDRSNENTGMFYAKCRLCEPNKKSLSVSRGTSYNLKAHILVNIFACYDRVIN